MTAVDPGSTGHREARLSALGFTPEGRPVDALPVFVRHHMASEPVVLDPELPAGSALRRLRAERMRHAPVAEDGALVGIVTDRDLLRVLPATIGQAEAGDTWHTPLARVMTTELVTVGPNDHVEDAARLLLEHRIHGLPVVDEGQLVGMLTDTDLFDVFARMLSQPAQHRLTLISEPAHADGSRPDLVRVAVACGLEVTSLVSQELPEGGIASEVALNGAMEAVRRYLERLAAIGVSRLDLRPGARRSA